MHTLHRFPGNFIPQIPSHLIHILSEPGDLVLDPFAGSGTTVVEAVRLGRKALGSDQTKACVYIARTKLEAYNHPLTNGTRERVVSELAWPHLCQTDEPGLNGEGTNEELKNWYSDTTLRQLKFLWKLVEACDVKERPSLKLLFSDLLFTCASSGNALTSGGKTRRHHWGWIADNVIPSVRPDHDAISLFTERLLHAEGVELRSGAAEAASVVRGDARSLDVQSASVDLIVTSPPYISMIDYSLANRLLYLWMNWDLAEDKETEIGARFKRKRRMLVSEYLSDMDACWREVARVLRAGGYCAVVLGESRKYPGTALRALESLGQLLSLTWGPKERVPTRRRVSNRQATEPAEFIAVFQKP